MPTGLAQQEKPESRARLQSCARTYCAQWPCSAANRSANSTLHMWMFRHHGRRHDANPLLTQAELGAAEKNLRLDHLPRVHPVIRIECLLDRAHCVERRAVLDSQILLPSGTDAMLAGARPTHRQRPQNDF